MWIFNSIFGKVFEFLFFPVRNLSPWFGMAIISLLTSLLMLFVFRYTSNQAGIRKVKNKIKAHLLELRLYKDSLSLTLRAQGNIFLSNFRYIGYSSKPVLIMIIPLVLIIFQMNLWFGCRSFKPLETVMVKMKFKADVDINTIHITPLENPFLKTETPPLRITLDKEINWRFQVKEEGLHSLTFVINGQEVSKTIVAGKKSLARISPIKVRANFIDELINPGEKPLPKGLPLKSIEVKYPSKKMEIFGLRLHWLIVYFVLSIILGFAFKGVFKVEI